MPPDLWVQPAEVRRRIAVLWAERISLPAHLVRPWVAPPAVLQPAEKIIELLRQRSRPYLFSNTLAPAVAAGTLKVLDILENDLSMREKLFENTRLFAERIKEIGLDVMDRGAPIIPVMLYDEHKAVEMAKRMMEKGVYVVAFSYPVVPKGKARIRTQLSAALSREDIEYIVDCFRQVKEEMGL